MRYSCAMPLASGTRLGVYEILAPLGAGGMGEVYRARDSRLGRDVALKILPADVAADPDRLARFEHEARMVARLNHPNIVTLFAIEDVGGTRFLIMELVDGQSLERQIAPGGRPAPQLLEWGAALADALGAAHMQGITHRDLKPANVVLMTDGRVKVLDFGLAKLADAAGSGSGDDATLAGMSIPGQIMGTVPYMAPEQVRGEAVDPRTDVFALGVVLYELSTGRRPFEGATLGVISSAILRDAPESLVKVRPDLPADLVRIIERCLEKEPRARFQSANEVGTELRRVRLSRSRHSIAVLPFTNMSPDADNEYFCDGLAEELLNALSKVDDLKVAARTSAFSFKGKDVDVSEIGARLSVNHVLEGSVRRSGNRLRISVQLVNAADGFHLWSERYDRELRDIFDVQDEIALAVVGALKVMLFGDEKAALLKRHTDDAAVHELFLKGRYYSQKYSAEGWTRAIEFFQRAIDRQPDHAPAHAGKAVCHGCLWFFGLLPAGQTVPHCKAATHKALETDPVLAEAHAALAMITFFYDWEWERAEQAYKQSIALNSNNAEALSYYALFLAFEGRADEALDQAQRALGIDPLSPLINMTVGWTYFSIGRSDRALDQVGKMIEIEPEFYGVYWLKGAIRLAEGRYGDAVEELKRAVSLGGHQIVVADLASAYGLAGRTEDAASILDQLLEMRRQQYVPAICMARVYSRLGETDKAIEWLETAFDERNGEMVFLQGEIAGAAEGDSLNQLGTDPRVKDLLRRMNLPQ
jgi:eukaryotic-like serine/threonine-protein kinase